MWRIYTAWHQATARTIVHFGRAVKKRNANLLVGTFYGCTSYFDGSTCSGMLTIMDCGAGDFLAVRGTYARRSVTQREMQDSFRLRNQIYICEDDSCTYRCKPWMQRDTMVL